MAFHLSEKMNSTWMETVAPSYPGLLSNRGVDTSFARASDPRFARPHFAASAEFRGDPNHFGAFWRKKTE
jgi:hypothetical protein